jgi:hypothetical protein
MCEAIPADSIAKVVPQVDQCLDSFRELAKTHRRLNIFLAEEIGKRCHYLLEHYADFDPEHQAYIMGAVKYFAIAEDALSETDFATGFDDDARVMNHVLEELGLEDMYIEVR